MHLKILKKLNTFKKHFIDLLYPNKCISCKTIVDTQGFCLNCWKNLKFIDKNSCRICGKQLNIANSTSLICANCLKRKYYFNQNISIFVYNRTIAKAIFNFKFKGKIFLYKNFANILKTKINSFMYDIDYIICIPMHIKRLRQRGYNQSFLLAQELSKLTNIPFIKDLLIKTKHTQRQAKLHGKSRKQNIKNSFDIKTEYLDLIKDKNILIIDDVFTTGSTIDECAKILRTKSDVNKIMSLTIARTGGLV